MVTLVGLASMKPHMTSTIACTVVCTPISPSGNVHMTQCQILNTTILVTILSYYLLNYDKNSQHFQARNDVLSKVMNKVIGFQWELTNFKYLF